MAAPAPATAPAAAAAPSGRLAGWRHLHAGATIVVCGCGRSLAELPTPERWLTIGVNDVGRLFDPTYLVVVNPRSQFRGDRFRHVAASRARALFTQLDPRRDLALTHPAIVRFRLGRRGGTDLDDPDALPYTRNSPYVAACLAAFLGARRIGLIGVDFTDHHFFAPTGSHPLARELAQIDREYGRLAAALARRGVELVNLSAESRLAALPKAPAAEFLAVADGSAAPAAVRPPALELVPPPPAPRPRPVAAAPDAVAPPRVFFVHYQFLSCGDVFTRGLEHAAADLGLAWEGAPWNDPRLAARIARFRPDLLFVVHGRRFRQRWGERFRGLHSAVWLLDEPYEVDDTERTSSGFDVVFVNDPATLGRHRNAHYLPVAWDPHRHTPGAEAARCHDVGFIGGGNPAREAALLRLAREGLLSYVVGGPWRAPELRALARSGNVPPERTAEIYRQTRLVVNVFRDRHHFNRRGLPATALNPRIYEALACGALVVSEERDELAAVFPELPRFADADGLVAAVRGLLADPGRRGRLLAACRERLAPHTYAERLRAALAAALPGRCAGTAAGAPVAGETRLAKAPAAGERRPGRRRRGPADPGAPPTYGILMAVHGGFEMTRLAVLRTLRHSAGADARLTVVDNASPDGTREWLRLLARRGDLDLVEAAENLGHGPALELARSRTRSPILVTLDSDAFPLADDWLERLRARLEEGAAVAGILHHRDYVHPSCLMVARRTLDELGVTFRDEKHRGSGGLDVGERLSVEVRRRGGRLAGLERTADRGRGSASEPVYLGAEYEGIVYHQWYATRAAAAPGRAVDDVPRAALDRALAEVIEEGRREPREVTVVVGVRAGDEPRRRNAHATLTALALQDLERWRYRVIVVEQDAAPRLAADPAFAPLADRWLFAYNPGAYNRGWGFNVGAVAAAGGDPAAAGALCLLDADLLVAPDFLRRGLAALSAGARALLPYREVLYLDAPSTARAIAAAGAAPDPVRLAGRRFTDSQGGALWADAALYLEIGGHDERFRGWGYEDREICRRLARAAGGLPRLDGCLLHLDHPRPPEADAAAQANERLWAGLRRRAVRPPAAAAAALGDPRRYAGEAPPAAADPPPADPAALPGHRAWEHWNEWSPERIARIVEDEVASDPARSARRDLAELAVRLGSRLLDLGCGPGALWPHLEPHRSRISWAATDVTHAMLRIARRHRPGVPLVQADAGCLPWKSGAFDVVVLRHLLEHLPPWLMARTLAEVLRVARRAVLVAFYVPPDLAGPRRTAQVGEGFLETRWTAAEVEAQVAAAGWKVAGLRLLGGAETDEVWILAPGDLAGELFLRPEPPAPSSAEPLKISIVMPTYRRPHRLARTVAGVLAQSYGNWELIVVDNAGGADPGTADPRVRLVRHNEQASASWARNRGLGYATGDLVCFFDDDDDMAPDYLARFAAAFQRHPGAKMVRCGMYVAAGRVDYSFATPEVCLRRAYATPTWRRGGAHDQTYFKEIVARNGWSGSRDVVLLRAPLCRANHDPVGGLRAGAT
jgi:glycosyltransferase involved in cell wall biosynthesis